MTGWITGRKNCTILDNESRVATVRRLLKRLHSCFLRLWRPACFCVLTALLLGSLKQLFEVVISFQYWMGNVEAQNLKFVNYMLLVIPCVVCGMLLLWCFARHSFRFSIRSMGLSIALCSILMVMVSDTLYQRQARSLVRRLGGSISICDASQHASNERARRRWAWPAWPTASAMKGEVMSESEVFQIIFHGSQVNNHVLPHLRHFSKLRILRLTNTSVDDAGLRHLSQMDHLHTLSLRGSRVHGDGLTHLADLPDLSNLFLDRLPITDKALQPMKDHEKLRNLSLNDCAVTDEGLGHLSKRLHKVSLAGAQITDRGLLQLSRLRSLKELDVSYTSVTDAGMKHLAVHTNLRKLYLAGTDVGDDGVAHLGGLPRLVELDVRGTQVTLAGLRRLDNYENVATIYCDQRQSKQNEEVKRPALIHNGSTGRASRVAHPLLVSLPVWNGFAGKSYVLGRLPIGLLGLL